MDKQTSSNGASGVVPRKVTARTQKKGGDGSPQKPSSEILSGEKSKESADI